MLDDHSSGCCYYFCTTVQLTVSWNRWLEYLFFFPGKKLFLLMFLIDGCGQWKSILLKQMMLEIVLQLDIECRECGQTIERHNGAHEKSFVSQTNTSNKFNRLQWVWARNFPRCVYVCAWRYRRTIIWCARLCIINDCHRANIIASRYARCT